jgi:hypothetical protein
MGSVMVLVGLLLRLHGPTVEGDVFPYFKPDPPFETNRVATECARFDIRCLLQHESHVLTMAVMAGDETLCANAVRPKACQDAYELIVGDIRLAPSAQK